LMENLPPFGIAFKDMEYSVMHEPEKSN